MPVPDKWADEETVEIDPQLQAQYDFCVSQAKEWAERANQLREQIEAAMGTATAALVAGQKTFTRRPTARLAVKALCRDYPELTQHYMRNRVTQEFDEDTFVKLHGDIADRYRVTQFNRLD